MGYGLFKEQVCEDHILILFFCWGECGSDSGVMKLPMGGGSNLMQMYGDFEGFPVFDSALFLGNL